MHYKQFCDFLCPSWQVRQKVKTMKAVIEKDSRFRNIKCPNHFVDTSYVKNVEVASFSPELHQHSQPLDQRLLRPFRNF